MEQYTRDKLIIDNQRLVYHTYEQLSKTDLVIKNKDDIVSEGMIGLIKAADTFDMSRGCKFSTYAASCIKDGRFTSKEVSFDLPEGFNLVINDCYPLLNLVRFVSDKKVIKNGCVFIEVALCKTNNLDEYDMTKLHDYGAQVRGKPFEVTRGTGTARAAYFTSGTYMDVYEEHYILKEPINGDNIFKVRVLNRAGKGKKIEAAVEDSLRLPIVKKFLDSIHYE